VLVAGAVVVSTPPATLEEAEAAEAGEAAGMSVSLDGFAWFDDAFDPVDAIEHAAATARLEATAMRWAAFMERRRSKWRA
jgi:hypothetical protein